METLEELIKASEIVPEARIESFSKRVSPQGCESGKTTAPPSTEPSPEFHFNPNEPFDIDGSMMLEAPAWPSLREGASGGWDFCSDASDGEEDTQAPFDDETEGTWCIVADDDGDELSHMKLQGDALESGENRRKSTTYADRFHGVPKTKVLPAAHGAIAPPWKSSVSTPIDCHASAEQEREAWPCEHVDSRDSRVPRWRKQDKASWNKKQQKRVADRTARRLSQSIKARGWLEEDEENANAAVWQ
jgi:hypothetical protein